MWRRSYRNWTVAILSADIIAPRKLEVLAHHQSQAERSYLEAEAVTSTVRYWTRQLAGQARYAEPFELVSALTHISDTSIV
jgi:hypothetical protein